MSQVDGQARATSAAAILLAPRLTHHGYETLRRFPALDGVRAIAAIMVVAFHFGGPHFAFISGWLGVHLFFVMSGFLITTLLLREESLGGRISLPNFWIRRVFRILPAYYVTLIITVIVLWTLGTFVAEGGPQSIGWFAGVSPELAPTTLGFDPAWTIGIEQKFYLVWPVLAFMVVARRPILRVVVWILALTAVLVLSFAYNSYYIHFGVILFGCGIAMLLHSSRAFRFVQFLSSPIAGAVALVALLVVQLSARQLILYFNSELQVILLYGFCAAALVPSLCSLTWGTRALTWTPLRWLGDRSYSLYLLQILSSWIGHGLFPTLGGPRFLLVVLVVDVVLADAMHRWIEVPGIRFGKRWIDRRAIRAGGASERVLILGGQPEGGIPRGEMDEVHGISG